MTTPDRPNPDELSLREVLTRLGRHAGMIVRAALVAGLIALVCTFFFKDWYRPEATVSIEQPRQRQGDPLVPLDTLVQNFRRLGEGANLHAPILARLATEEGLEMAAREFAGRLTIEVPRESNFLFLGWRDTDPARATRVTNALALALTEATDRFNTDEVARFLARYHSDVAQARTEATEAAQRLAQFQSANQLDLLTDRITVASTRRSELEAEARVVDFALAQVRENPAGQTLAAAEEQRTATRAQLMATTLESARTALLGQSSDCVRALAQARTDLAAERESLAALEAGLASEERVIRLRRAISDVPELQQAAARASGRAVEDLANLSLESETLNPSFTETQTQVIQSRARVAELEERESQLATRLAELTPAIASTETAIARAQMALDRADRGVALADEEFRTLVETSAAGLETRRRLLGGEMTALTASLEAMRSRLITLTAEQRMLQQESDLAYERLQRFGEALATARLSVLESLPTVAVRTLAAVPAQPMPKNRKVFILAAMALGFALGLLRAYITEF